MKISFIMNVRMPTEKAHGYQIAKMCEVLAVEDAQVSLVVPTRKNETKGDIFSYYGIRDNFSIRYIPAFDALSFFRGSRFGFYLQALSFLWALRREVVLRDMVIITRNPEVVWWYGRRGYRVFYDAHSFPGRGQWLLKLLLARALGIIANSNGTADAFRKVGFTNVLVAPNAVDLKEFEEAPRRERSVLGLPAGRIAMYVGHLYEWKGVGVVVEAARRSKRSDLMFVLVGGIEADIARYREITRDLPNVLILGRRPHSEVPVLIKSADVLLLPNIPATEESVRYTSPIKMFEYMASGVPIVASSLPSIREVLNDENAVLVEAGNPDALLDGIEQAFSDEAKERALRAGEEVKKYTWTSRAQTIINFLNV